MRKLVFLVFILLYLASTHKAEENESFNYSVCDDGVVGLLIDSCKLMIYTVAKFIIP